MYCSTIKASIFQVWTMLDKWLFSGKIVDWLWSYTELLMMRTECIYFQRRKLSSRKTEMFRMSKHCDAWMEYRIDDTESQLTAQPKPFSKQSRRVYAFLFASDPLNIFLLIINWDSLLRAFFYTPWSTRTYSIAKAMIYLLPHLQAFTQLSKFSVTSMELFMFCVMNLKRRQHQQSFCSVFYYAHKICYSLVDIHMQNIPMCYAYFFDGICVSYEMKNMICIKSTYSRWCRVCDDWLPCCWTNGSFILSSCIQIKFGIEILSSAGQEK